ncbi:MAG: hypothetical protein HY707_03410 [Ignavibacteriae bacterium]|nr:hypothetical protein [Ignavibacteriota bacterium]
MKKLYLLVGTHKGAFMLTSNLDRKKWKQHGPFLQGGDVNHLTMNPDDDGTLYACANSYGKKGCQG